MSLMRELRKAAAQQGWCVETTGGGHLRWVSPDGAVVVTAKTPSDKRSMLNARAQLRRRGLDV